VTVLDQKYLLCPTVLLNQLCREYFSFFLAKLISNLYEDFLNAFLELAFVSNNLNLRHLGKFLF